MDAVQLAFELDFPPCVLMRRLLEALQLGLTKERITRVLRAPDQLPALVIPGALDALARTAGAAAAAQAVLAQAIGSSEAAGGDPGGWQQRQLEGQCGDEAEVLRERGQRLLERLQRDVEACVLCDRIYSPASGAWQRRRVQPLRLPAPPGPLLGYCWPGNACRIMPGRASRAPQHLPIDARSV